MIAKGNLHGNGDKLAAYLTTGKEGERAELVETRGFASRDIHTAFLDVEIQAYGTRCQKPFFHGYTRLAPGEELTANNGCTSPTAWKSGLALKASHARSRSIIRRTARPTCMSRGAGSTPRRCAPSIPACTKTISRKSAARWKSSSASAGAELPRAERPDARAGRKEFEESRRLDTDLKAIRNTIMTACSSRTAAKAFNAALDAQRVDAGEWRPARLLHRHRCRRAAACPQQEAHRHDAGRDPRPSRRPRPTQLPSVEEARGRQQERTAEIEKTQSQAPQPVGLRLVFTSAANRITEPSAPIFDRDAAEAAWTEQLTAAAIAKDEATPSTPKPEREGEGPQPADEGIPTSPAASENAPAPTTTRPNVVPEPELAGSAASGFKSPERAASGIFGGIAKVAETILGGLFSFFGAAEPKLSPQQAERATQAADERSEAQERPSPPGKSRQRGIVSSPNRTVSSSRWI